MEKPRVKVICLLKCLDEYLFANVLDTYKNEYFYILPGGGVEFGEKTIDAVKREIKEEVNYDLKNPKLISTIEHFFEYKGISKHEVTFFYLEEVSEKSLFSNELIDNGNHFPALWIKKSEVPNYNVVPIQVKEWIIKNS